MIAQLINTNPSSSHNVRLKGKTIKNHNKYWYQKISIQTKKIVFVQKRRWLNTK
jgi:hypothetical protein